MKKINNPFSTLDASKSYLNGKFVGGYLPRQTADYLNLLALYNNSSIQNVLESIVLKWKETEEPESSILETLADRAFMEWLRIKDTRVLSFEEYKREIKTMLKKKKIPQTQIDSIIKELHQRKGIQ